MFTAIGGNDSYKMTMGHLIQGSDFCHNLVPCMLKGEDLKSIDNCLASRFWILSFASWNPCFAVWKIPHWWRSARPSCRPCQVTVSNCLPSILLCCQSDDDEKSMTTQNGIAEILLDRTAFLLKGLEKFPLPHTQNIHFTLVIHGCNLRQPWWKGPDGVTMAMIPHLQFQLNKYLMPW